MRLEPAPDMTDVARRPRPGAELTSAPLRLFRNSVARPCSSFARSSSTSLFYLNLDGAADRGAADLSSCRGAASSVMAKTWGAHQPLAAARDLRHPSTRCRGLEKLPAGGYLVAAKHQSTWETFALLPLFDDSDLHHQARAEWIPLFGWFTIKADMIPIDRGAGAQAIPKMLAHARQALRDGRQIIIFPEGTRRAAGAEPAYKFGVARLYAELDVPCVPIALNSGLFWPRRKFLRYPGTIVVEILDPIPPGLEPNAFFERLQDDIEGATARLIEEGRRESGEATARASAVA